MSVYIKGMEMPTTGLYFVSVDNSCGKDKTVITVERMLGNRDVRTIIGSYELIPVPDHGRLVDAEAVAEAIELDDRSTLPEVWHIKEVLSDVPTIIPADKEVET